MIMTLWKSTAITLVVLIGMLCSISICAADVLEDALVAVWLFDEDQGLTAKDASGNGHDGDIKGAKWVQGEIGTALEFDGDGNIVEFHIMLISISPNTQYRRGSKRSQPASGKP